MEPSQSIEVVKQALQPVNVSGALLIVQVCILIIFWLGLSLLEFSSGKQRRNSHSLLTIFAIASIILVAFIKEFYTIWSPILGDDIHLPTLARSNAFNVTFALDIFVTWRLIKRTGGSSNSPFTPMLFLIPTLSIFLRQPPAVFIIYAIVIYLLYWISDYDVNESSFRENEAPIKIAHRAVNFACLALGIAIGFITRPVTL